MFHALQHYFAGIALHHLCDWAIILRRYGLHIPNEIKDKALLAGIAAMTELCNRHLGTSQQVDGAKEIADELMDEMLSPLYCNPMPKGSKLGIIIFKAKRMARCYKLKNKILKHSFANIIWKTVINHIRYPETIFR